MQNQTNVDAAPVQPIVTMPFAPYYSDDAVTIYNADCRQVLPCLPKFDLLLTDPPYGLTWGGTGFKKQPLLDHKEAGEWDNLPDKSTMDVVFASAKRRVIWGGNYLAGHLGACKGPLVWDKMTGKNKFADGEMAWSDIAGTMRIFRHQWCGAFKDSERGERSIHPTQKPVAVMRWCLSLAVDSETIVDPFAGVGTTGVACKLEGRKAVLIEISEAYCESAAKRLSQGVLF